MASRDLSHAAGRRALCIAAALFAGGAAPGFAADSAAPPSRSLLDLPLEELTRVVVTSVSRREEKLSGAPASIYVITGDDIRRAGVTSIPEALRLAPNVLVVRGNATEYLVTARGFNSASAFSNKLLVLLDGRVLYSPLFSGVFWDAQDVMLEDVARIEVISGPGTTLWGSNAYNGVINIITRPAAETQGTLIAAGGGNTERGTAMRHGGAFGRDGHYRLYGKVFQRDAFDLPGGAPAMDAGDRGQVGFRADWGAAGDTLSVQGDVYRADIDQLVGGSRDLAGANIMAHWQRALGNGSQLRVKAYYDRVERDQPNNVREKLDIFDLEIEHALPQMGRHRVLWGGGYRYAHDALEAIPAAAIFVPATQGLTWVQAFANDQIALTDRLELTLGLKLEHNDYTGAEWLPTVRLAWRLADNRMLWGAVSRAVRAPSRIDREAFTPGPPAVSLHGGPNFSSEVANVTEVGYRSQPTPALSYSVTAFYHDHDRLRSIELVPPGFEFGNQIEARTKGVEAWGTYRVNRGWRLTGGVVRLVNELEFKPGGNSLGTTSAQANDPGHWWTLRSQWDLSARHALDVMVRHVGSQPEPFLPAYTAVDARLGWQATRRLELSLTLRNLFDPAHSEFAGPPGAEFGRAYFFKLLWRP